MRSRFLLLAAGMLSTPLLAQTGSEGLYKLESLSGAGGRPWRLTALLDGIPCSDQGSIQFTDTQIGPGELILKEDHTVEARWRHRITITYSYQPDHYCVPWALGTSDPSGAASWNSQWYYHYISGTPFIRPLNSLTVEFDTEATGTWSGNLSLNLNCTSQCNVTAKYKPENSMALQSESFICTLNTTVSASGSGGPNPDFTIDTLHTFITELANQQLTGNRYLSVEDALRNGTDLVVSADGEWVRKTVRNWNYKGTRFTFSPTSGDMDAHYTQYYLLNVNAPFGFYAQGSYGTVSGIQEARFRYGSTTFQTSIEGGYADASSLNYGDAAPQIDVDILTDGAVALTLTKALDKVPVSPWAAPAGAWTAAAGVRYKRSPLNWPISMAATRSLTGASILTGLWGISGSASSQFGVAAHSLGIPQKGDLTANVQFKVAKKQLGFSLNGRHHTTLNGAGLNCSGEFGSSPLKAKWQQRVSLVSLVPGAGAALSALGPLGARISGGAGASIEAGVTGTLNGTYVATPGDTEPRFTSGTLTADAYLKAQVNPVPRFARGIVNLDISGGGGAIMVIDLAPSPSVASLTGYLEFALTAKLFNLETNTDKQWTFGDPAPSMMMMAGENESFSPSVSAFSAGAPNELPAQSMADMFFVHSPDERIVVYSEPHPTLPAPATRIVARRKDYGENWPTHTTAETNGKANFAPVFARATSTPGIGTSIPTNFSRGVLVWSQATGTAPANNNDLAAYMDSTELRFQYYNVSSFNGGFEGPERELTANSAADFGPSLVNCASNKDVRLFWTRGSGMDLTGSTTPLQIMTRNWTTYHPGAPANDPSTAWSAEVTAVSGLAHIVDWRATAWDPQNAAIAIIADMDGDLSTLDDTELWLARETAGVWAAPVRLTTNSVADEAPVMFFKSAGTLVIGWRQGDEVVGSFDLDNSPTPATWFDAASEIAEQWDGARLYYRASEDSLVLIWPHDTGLAYTEQAYGAPASGSAWPKVRHHDFGGGVVSNVALHFYPSLNDEDGYFSAIVENSTAAGLNDVPVHENACMQSGVLKFGAAGRSTQVAEAITSNTNPQLGDDVRFSVHAESPHALSYSWSKDGVPLPHFTGPEMELLNLTFADEGTYTVAISDGTGIITQTFTVILPMTYATWIALYAPGGGPGLLPEDDFDLDGCKNVLEYLFDTDPTDPTDCDAGDLTESAIPATGEMLFHINSRASDLTYMIEFTEDFVTWTDVTAIFTTHPLGDGRDAMHLFAPFNADSVNSFENYGDFPMPVQSRGFYRVRLVSGP